ncbi:MAG: hypothetical protein KAX65_15040 [Caldilineaceae bacterium]|nr:hypothetical protein [Caldilineaceae bacterium]
MIKTFAAALALSVVAYILWATTDTITWFAREAAALALLSVRVCGGLLIVVVATGATWFLLRQQYERNRQRDGAFALREYWLSPWWVRLGNWLAGRPNARLIYDPNANMSHAAIVADNIYVVEPAAGWDRQLAYQQDIERTRRTQAAVPGDGVVGLPWYAGTGAHGVANAATGRLLAGAYDRQPRPVTVTPPPAAPELPPPPAVVPLADALERTETQAWPLGYAADGTLCHFAPLWHSHAAIVGAPGTGKTTSAGYLLAAHALRQGWRVVILDADNGLSWAAFTPWAEHAETDSESLPGQLGALMVEFERRMAVMREAGTTDIGMLPSQRRLLIVVEEYGDLINTLRLRNKAAGEQADSDMDTLLRRGRKAGMHVLLIDQYPEKWSNQIIAGTKFRAVFQLGPNQGAKMQEYHAHELPARGAFLWQGKQYSAWHTQPELRRLLADVPALSAGGRLLDGARSAVPARVGGGGSPEVERQNGAHNASQERNAGTPQDDAPGRWDDVVAGWFAAHPQALTGPALGISDLARAMCRDNEGDDASYEAYKGRAHKLFHEFRASVGFVGGDGAVFGPKETGGKKKKASHDW